MESLVETFHIDFKLLIAQIINFGIVFVVLYYFAIKPIFKTMTERTETIEEGLRNAEESELTLQKSNEEYTKVLNESKKQANEIIENAQKKGEERRDSEVEKAKTDIQEIIVKEKAKVYEERDKMLKETKEKVADLIIDATKKITGENINTEKDEDYIRKSFKKISDIKSDS